MEIQLQTRNIKATPRLEEHVEKKVSKLDRYLPNIQEVRVDLAMERHRKGGDRYAAQLTVRNTRGVILRAEEKQQEELYAALDVALDKMYRQIRRYKGKRQRRGGRYAASEAELAVMEPLPGDEGPEGIAEEEESKLQIVRRKQVELVPMSEEEAIDQMELLGHNFFIFFNANTAKIGVLYRREEGNYGVLEPDVA